MAYLGQVMMETLRFMPPVPHSTVSTLETDTMIGKYRIKAGDIVQVNITGLHRHPDHWKKPH